MSAALQRVNRCMQLTRTGNKYRFNKYELDFGSRDMKEIVFRSLSFCIPNMLNCRETNYKILKFIDSKGIIDRTEMEPYIKSMPTKSEFERMSQLFDSFSNKVDKIPLLLEILCNLDTIGMNNVSDDIRKIINEKFPGSITKICERKLKELYNPDKENCSADEIEIFRSSLDSTEIYDQENGSGDYITPNSTGSTGLPEEIKQKEDTHQPTSCCFHCTNHYKNVVAVAVVAACSTCFAYSYLSQVQVPAAIHSTIDTIASYFSPSPTSVALAIQSVPSCNDVVADTSQDKLVVMKFLTEIAFSKFVDSMGTCKIGFGIFFSSC